MINKMPSIFVGHGNPMNTLENNPYTKGWTKLGSEIPHPKAILSVSAHWYLPETSVTSMTNPKTIHDFGGFPDELYRVSYPAPGDPALASRIQNLLAPIPIKPDQDWGLDHGTWSVLCHMFPKADIPVVQLSIDKRRPASFHFEIGSLLSPLRDEGVLVVGSGNLVHNLRAYNWDDRNTEAYDWAARFEKNARELVISRDFEKLVNYEQLGNDARLSIPTPDHYLPLLYILGLSTAEDEISFPVDGIEGGSISMLAVRFG